MRRGTVWFAFFVSLILLSAPFPADAAYRLPDTGQTTCYDDTGVISCPGVGQAFHGQDASYAGPPPSIESPVGGMAHDLNTGLTWQTADEALQGSLGSAEAHCASLRLGGHTDWRLPDNRDLMTLADYGAFDPAIDTLHFPSCHSDLYWSAGPYAFGGSFSWFANFRDGAVMVDGPWNRPVRCVRGAQPASLFVDHGDGTVSDAATQLVWQKTDDGTPRNWEAALSYCENLTLADRVDWRLPDVRQLQSILDYARTTVYVPPALDGREAGYWSGSTYVDLPALGWYVNFDASEPRSAWLTGKSAAQLYVRCVRGGTWATTYRVLFRDRAELEALRRYRREILWNTVRGRLYVELLYEDSDDALQVLLDHPELLWRAADLVQENMAAVRAVLRGRTGVIRDTAAFAAFLEDYAEQSPPSLKALAELVRHDLLRHRDSHRSFLGFTLRKPASDQPRRLRARPDERR